MKRDPLCDARTRGSRGEVCLFVMRMNKSMIRLERAHRLRLGNQWWAGSSKSFDDGAAESRHRRQSSQKRLRVVTTVTRHAGARA
jgi:hypothetical protein